MRKYLIRSFAISLSHFTYSSFYQPESKPQILKGLINSRSRVLVISVLDNTLKGLYRGPFVSREYVSTEFKCRRISVIVQRSASDKLADDSLVLLVCGLSLIPPEREKEFWQIVSNHRFVNDKLVSCKLSKCLYKCSYTHPIISSALNECLLIHI